MQQQPQERRRRSVSVGAESERRANRVCTCGASPPLASPPSLSGRGHRTASRAARHALATPPRGSAAAASPVAGVPPCIHRWVLAVMLLLVMLAMVWKPASAHNTPLRAAATHSLCRRRRSAVSLRVHPRAAPAAADRASTSSSSHQRPPAAAMAARRSQDDDSARGATPASVSGLSGAESDASGEQQWWLPQPHASLDEAHTEWRPAVPLAEALQCTVCRDLLKEAITAVECSHSCEWGALVLRRWLCGVPSQPLRGLGASSPRHHPTPSLRLPACPCAGTSAAPATVDCYDCIDSTVTVGGRANVCPVCKVLLGPNPWEHNKLKYDFMLDSIVRKVGGWRVCRECRLCRQQFENGFSKGGGGVQRCITRNTSTQPHTERAKPPPRAAGVPAPQAGRSARGAPPGA
jgi:hypothetical protein